MLSADGCRAVLARVRARTPVSPIKTPVKTPITTPSKTPIKTQHSTLLEINLSFFFSRPEFCRTAVANPGNLQHIPVDRFCMCLTYGTLWTSRRCDTELLLPHPFPILEIRVRNREHRG